MPHEKAVAIVTGAGTVIPILTSSKPSSNWWAFKAIAERFAHSDADMAKQAAMRRTVTD